jgi:hypothetical protein
MISITFLGLSGACLAGGLAGRAGNNPANAKKMNVKKVNFTMDAALDAIKKADKSTTRN